MSMVNLKTLEQTATRIKVKLHFALNYFLNSL